MQKYVSLGNQRRCKGVTVENRFSEIISMEQENVGSRQKQSTTHIDQNCSLQLLGVMQFHNKLAYTTPTT